jgi:hypothetical protein
MLMSTSMSTPSCRQVRICRDTLLVFVPITIWLVSCPPSLADDDRLLDRARRFEAMAEQVSQARMERVSDPIHESGDGYVFSRSAELHVEFQIGATRLGDQADAEALFPVKVTGFTREYDSRTQARPVTRRGGDLQRVKLTIAGLLSDEASPRAQIRPFQLDHATDYDAVQLVRDEIIANIQWYLPEVEIEGRQKFTEKTLVVDNQTDEPIWVFAQRHTRRRSDAGYQWQWLPGEPGTAESYRVLIAPRKTQPLLMRCEPRGVAGGSEPGESAVISPEDRDRPLIANRIRIWGESESGDRWETHRATDLWLVPANPRFNNERVYHDEHVQAYTWRIEPIVGPRQYSERLIAFKNNTTDKLTINGHYLSQENGETAWRALPNLQIEPGATAGPLSAQGMRVRASRVRFVARGDNLLFNKFARDSLHLVDESPAGRVYSAEKIGQFVYVFEAAAATTEGSGSPSQ